MPKKIIKRNLPVLSKMHIYCEGKKTEPNYIDKYLRKYFAGNRRKDLIKVEPTSKNTPLELVNAAINHKVSSDCPKNDVFWVVYDRESIAKYPDATHLKAIQKARSKGVNVALSNVCFELWILLHFKDNTASYSNYDDLMATSPLKAEFAKIGVAKYEKGQSAIFNLIVDDIGKARTRAAAMNVATIKSANPGVVEPHLLNPYTDMHLLLDAIDKFK
ncbi:MAG: RloB family protein [Burkholderiaceae bacterium]